MGNENSNQGTVVGSVIGNGSLNAENIAGRDINIYNTPIAPAYAPPNPPPPGELAPHGSIPPHSRMTLERNPHFVGREEELHQLAAALLYASDGEAQAISTHGIGGMGKSQLAVEYASRYGRFYEGGVYWVSFADGESVAGEIAACGAKAAIAPAFADLPLPQQVAQTMHGWEDGKERLLIFDNCEDPALLKQWRPQAGRCRILLTSRRAVWETHLAQTLPLDRLTRPQSINLLQQLADPQSQATATPDPNFGAIADELGNLPLALHLAGSYLHLYRYSETAATYLQALRQQLLQHESMHGEEAGDSPTDHTPSLTLTIRMSADKLGATATDADAKTLLTRLAYLAPGEPTGRDLLLEFAGMNADQKKERDKALQRLLELGLLEAEAGGAIKLHRTIAAYVRAEWGNDGVQTAVEQAVATKAYADNMSGFPVRLAAWLPHLRHVTTAALTRGDEQAATLATNVGYHLQAVGAYEEAQLYYEHSLAVDEKVLGSGHSATATSLNNLASLLQARGAHGEALPLYERALAIREVKLGLDHPDTATSLNNLAELLRMMGAYREALPLYERTLAILGPDHPHTATNLNNLALLLEAMGAYGEALPLHERALAIRETQLGSDHPDTAQSLDNQAGLLQAMGAYGKALLLNKRALTIWEAQLGTDHPATATSLNNQADLLRKMGAYEEALPLYERTLAILETQLGIEHPYTATSLNNLALLLQAMEDYEEALPYFKQALTVRQKTLGNDHPDTAGSLNNLAGLLKAMGQYGEARPLFERALAIFETSLGADHPSTKIVRDNLAALP